MLEGQNTAQWVYNSPTQDVTTLESYHGSNHFADDYELNITNKTFMLFGCLCFVMQGLNAACKALHFCKDLFLAKSKSFTSSCVMLYSL